MSEKIRIIMRIIELPSMYSWFLTKSVTKLALQSQKMTSSLKFRIGNRGKQNRRSDLFKQAIYTSFVRTRLSDICVLSIGLKQAFS